jgi:hypothetical protein
MGGEILGMDGIGTERHTCDAVALEDSEICLIPFSRLEELSREMHNLQHHFHKVMSREIVRDHGVMMLLGSMRAEERLAAFLVNLSQRFMARGYSPSEFYLRMTREEIGSYLGLKLETVSRPDKRPAEARAHHRHSAPEATRRPPAGLTAADPARPRQCPEPGRPANEAITGCAFAGTSLDLAVSIRLRRKNKGRPIGRPPYRRSDRFRRTLRRRVRRTA